MSTTPTSIQLPTDTDERLSSVAARLNKSKSDMIREVLEDALPRLEGEAVLAQRSAEARDELHQLPTTKEVAAEFGIDTSDISESDLDDVS